MSVLDALNVDFSLIPGTTNWISNEFNLSLNLPAKRIPFQSGRWGITSKRSRQIVDVLEGRGCHRLIDHSSSISLGILLLLFLTQSITNRSSIRIPFPMHSS
jgi:hypothetical protein